MDDVLLQRLHPRWYPDVAAMLLDRPSLAWVEAGSTSRGRPSADLAAFAEWRLVPRVLRDVTRVDTTTTVTGGELSMPVLAGPVGLLQVLHPEGEAGLAAGVAAAGTGAVVAASTSTPIEEVRAAAPATCLWLQLPNSPDRDAVAGLVERAAASGVSAVVPLVNAPVAAAHVAPEAGFRLPEGVAPAHPVAGGLNPGAGVADIAWLVGHSPVPVIPKGVTHPEDARRLVDVGVAGVVVSNHGCRQLPRAVGSLDALQAVAAEVGGEVDVHLDGGVRTGEDVLVALALGARAVLVGRLLAYALTVGGAAGVSRALDQLHAELVEAASLCGVPDLQAVDPGLVARVQAGARQPTIREERR